MKWTSSFTEASADGSGRCRSPNCGNWATALSPGPANEAGQTLTFLITTDNNAMFGTLPAISPTGTLTYTPAPNTHGTATVTVHLQDTGGTANGGQGTSAPQSFTITAPRRRPAQLHHRREPAGRQRGQRRTECGRRSPRASAPDRTKRGRVSRSW